MLGLLTAFFSSFICTLLIIRYKHLHHQYSADWDLSGPQKFHTQLIPRIGGISIAAGLLIATLIRFKSSANFLTEITLVLCAGPTFAIGLLEDLTKLISVRLRLFFTGISAALLVYLLQVHITGIGITVINPLFAIPYFGSMLTIFAVVGLANAYNIIDGFNGLSSMVGIITLLALTYVAFILGDLLIMYLSIIMIGGILGFFIWNYPRGLIFLGDGGAYLIGFWIASLSIMITYRHQEISPWFALLINGYPIIETLFTVYRRKIHQGKSPGQPDAIHFHTLIYRRVLNPHQYSESVFSANARTAPYLWALTCFSVTPAVLFWRSTIYLMIAAAFFSILYVWLYNKIVRFRIPRWMISI